MTGDRRGWMMIAAVLPLTLVNLVLAAQQRVDWVEAWPFWRGMTLDVTLLFAGAVLVAAVAFGVHAWRRGPHA